MKRIYLVSICCILTVMGFAQTIGEAQTWLKKGKYSEAKPVFHKYVKAQPTNASYNLGYGICCLKTNAIEQAIEHLQTAIKRRATEGYIYLGEAYDAAYRFDDAIGCYEEYIKLLTKQKKPKEEVERLLEKSKGYSRMLKGVEQVTVIDSFVVDKSRLIESYKLSDESGRLFTYKEYFKTETDHPGTVYETEIGNRVYYSDQGKKNLNIYTQTKLIDEWSKGKELPGSINEAGNANYPFVMTDGSTIYYATDGEGLGGYDIFVTRYNTNTDSYLTPENVGMPFNSPYNDYLYVVDEFNNLGWFASDRYQPEGKVCIYVFIPNATKQVYNYEANDPHKMVQLAQLASIKETWKDKKEVTDAKTRLNKAIDHKPEEQRHVDFEFIIDDARTYVQESDFKSPQAKQLFKSYKLLQNELKTKETKLARLRLEYSQASSADKGKLAPGILDLENRVLTMSEELDKLEVKVRNLEKSQSK